MWLNKEVMDQRRRLEIRQKEVTDKNIEVHIVGWDGKEGETELLSSVTGIMNKSPFWWLQVRECR